MFKSRKQEEQQHAKDIERLTRLHSLFTATDLGKRMYLWMNEQNIDISFDHKCQKNTRGYVRWPYDHVYLNPKSRDLDLVFTIAHEVRHLWQAREMQKIFNTTQPLLSYPFKNNPFALMIFNRIIEADASSFQHCFMIDHFDATGYDGKTVNLSDCSSWAVMDLGWDSKDAPLSVHRKTVFDLFFADQSRCLSYDKTKHQDPLDDLATSLSLMGYKHKKGKIRKNHNLTEDLIKVIGKTAWEEVPVDNYFSSLTHQFNLKMRGQYTAGFSKKHLKRLRRLSKKRPYKNMNTYTTADGRTRPLINVKKP